MTQKKFKEWKIFLLLLLIVLCFNKIFTEEYQNTEEEIERFKHRPPIHTHYPVPKYLPDGTMDHSAPVTWVPRPPQEPSGIEIVPIQRYQPDGVRISMAYIRYPNGYMLYRTMYEYTTLLDSLTGFWCYAINDEDGRLINSGYPLHLHDPNDLGIKINIKPSIEEIEEYREEKILEDEQTRWFDAPYKKMPSSDNVKSLVIFVKPSDKPCAEFNNNGYLDNYQNGHSVKDYYIAQSPTLCHSERSEESIMV